MRTLAHIEHGVRKASTGTYAMLENKLAWAPGSIDTILAGGEPTEVVSTLRRANPNPPSQGYALRSTKPAPCRRCPARSCCSEHDGAYRPPQHTPRHLGDWTAVTRTATGPKQS